MEELSNAEFTLLLLMAEQPGITGYTITQLVDERGLGAWAGVASSSVYNGLSRVEHRALAQSAPDDTKTGRGPRGRCYTLTPAGKRALRTALREALSTTREHDPRFNLALSGIDTLPATTVASCLRERAAYLAAEHTRLSAIRDAQAHEPTSAAGLLFDRILHVVEAERAWSAAAAQQIASRTERTDR